MSDLRSEDVTTYIYRTSEIQMSVSHLREPLLGVQDLDKEGELVVHDGETVPRLHE